MSFVRAASEEFLQLRAYLNASQELNHWISGAQKLALLNGAVDAGVLDALDTPQTAEEIAAATSIDKKTIVDLCQALEVHGVVQQDSEYYQLTPDYALLTSPAAAIPLANVLRQTTVMLGALQTMASAKANYTHMPSEDVLAMAAGAGISALSGAPHVAAEAIGQTLPEIEALWRTGVSHLEVGCGVGNSLFGIVMTYPLVTAVGIEIDELIAAEAARRAELLGITNRVELRRMDACELRDVESFATIQWSQFFFPAASRPIVLNAMYRALKPGGYLFMPWFGLVSDPFPQRGMLWRMAWRSLRRGSLSFLSFLQTALGATSERRRTERRFAARLRLIFTRWGVPVRSLGELESEVRESGFNILRVTPTSASQFALTRGFLLAQRDGI